jgi:CDP-diacylglycerol---glycerol-3-phosphate 3-phosphatidyltransferase
MFDGRFRTVVDKGVAPVGEGLRRTGITADHLTALGLVLAVGAAVAIGAGYLRVGLLLVILAALPDLLDGAVAKASGTSSSRGAFFDSVSDRVTDALLFGGIAWHLGNIGSFRGSMLAFAVMAVSQLVSYQRSKAESLGFDAKGGLMERAERIIVLCVGLFFHEILLVPVLWLMLVLTSVTAVQRFVKVWRQATPEVPLAPRRAAAVERREQRAQAARARRAARRNGRTTASARRQAEWRRRRSG